MTADLHSEAIRLLDESISSTKFMIENAHLYPDGPVKIAREALPVWEYLLMRIKQ